MKFDRIPPVPNWPPDLGATLGTKIESDMFDENLCDLDDRNFSLTDDFRENPDVLQRYGNGSASWYQDGTTERRMGC